MFVFLEKLDFLLAGRLGTIGVSLGLGLNCGVCWGSAKLKLEPLRIFFRFSRDFPSFDPISLRFVLTELGSNEVVEARDPPDPLLILGLISGM